VRLGGPNAESHLLWTWGPVPGSVEVTQDPDRGDALWEFIRLVTLDDEAVLSFARRWGVLELCEAHGLPFAHDPKAQGFDYALLPILGGEGGPPRELPDFCRPAAFETGWYAEPTDLWRTWARHWRSALRLLAELARGQVGSAENWGLVLGRNPNPASIQLLAEQSIDRQCENLAALAEHWLNQARTVPTVWWDGQFRRGLAAGAGLFGVLATQYVAIMTSDLGRPSTCSRCGEPYAAERKPRADTRNYCPPCRPEAAKQNKRLSARRRRGRVDGKMSESPD